ncbi:hypothetical protein EF834_03475 [Rhodococcus spongiicola]|uniref:Pentapeptide repeat-containing protein n=1 Tax=Rhodococcus spongiicola TaxID=2487352 RepID=A0A438B6A7_9NOCA|nr:hypothetical protein EF834_03475 [Rhodococcus spongiicola]
MRTGTRSGARWSTSAGWFCGSAPSASTGWPSCPGRRSHRRIPHFSGAHFSGAHFSGAHFSGAHFSGAHFSGPSRPRSDSSTPRTRSVSACVQPSGLVTATQPSRMVVP